MTDPMPPAILVLDDEPSSVNLLRITLGMDYTVYTATSGDSALALLAENPDIAVALIDQRMPGMSGTEFIQRTIEPYPHLVRIILTGYTDTESLIQAINAGRVYRYLTKPWNKEELLVTVHQGMEVHRLERENQRLHEELRQANERLKVENASLRREVKGRYRFDEIIGNSLALQRALGLVERVIASNTTVLITGETGTGKELVARAIHYNGARAERPFISINCTDFTPEMLSSELFGHKRGSFTGAIEDRQGLFKAADGGTILLDEIGDCPENVQARLLRVLDQGEIRRVGDDRLSRVDVRVIAATNRDLDAEVRNGRFRKDLFYRLNVFQIALPPLRDRRDDVPILAEHFLARLCRNSTKHVPGFTAESLAAMQSYGFAGNVRELENIVERAFTLAEDGAYVTPDLLPDAVLADAPTTALEGGSLRAMLEQFEARVLRDALDRNGGNQTRTAQEIGISRRALIDKLQRLSIAKVPKAS